MANSTNNVKIEKSDWVSSFTLIGEVKLNDNSFKIDEKASSSNWIYNQMNIGINCGEKYGTTYVSMMGGYSGDGNSIIYAHGKDYDGKDDFNNKITVAWEDRNNESILEDIGDFCFITVGLEKTTKGKTFYNKFLSQYDAIQYIMNHIEDGMVVNIKGRLKYQTYNDNVYIQKEVTSIVLSKIDDVSKYKATWVQTMLIDKDSTNMTKDYIDKGKGILYIDARVLDYAKLVNGHEYKGQYPFRIQVEYAMDFSNENQCKKIYNKLFNVKKGIRQITFEGEFISGGAVVTISWDDVPDDIKGLVECGVYTKENALAKCSENGSKVDRMVITKPLIRLVGEDKYPVIQLFDERYKEDDLIIDLDFKEPDDDLPFSLDDEDDNGSNGDNGKDESMDWLDNL